MKFNIRRQGKQTLCIIKIHIYIKTKKFIYLFIYKIFNILIHIDPIHSKKIF